MDYTTCYCRSLKCLMFGQGASRAYVKMHDWQRQGPRFRCARCGGIVSATTGTAYAGIRTDLNTYLRGATALAEGLSIRATGRLLGVDKDTANRTGCEFFVAQTLLAWAKVYGNSVIRGLCGQKNAWYFVAEHGLGMRLIAMFFGLPVPEAQTARLSIFSSYFKRLERFQKRATSS